MKKCKVCLQIKKLSEFYKHASNKDRLFKTCKSCYKESVKKRYNEDPEKHLDRMFKRKYGISLQDKADILAKQSGLCAICENSIVEATKSHQDHCHTTGKIRGILCHSCNVGLGHFKDSLKILNSAQNYLKKYTKN